LIFPIRAIQAILWHRRARVRSLLISSLRCLDRRFCFSDHGDHARCRRSRRLNGPLPNPWAAISISCIFGAFFGLSCRLLLPGLPFNFLFFTFGDLCQYGNFLHPLPYPLYRPISTQGHPTSPKNRQRVATPKAQNATGAPLRSLSTSTIAVDWSGGNCPLGQLTNASCRSISPDIPRSSPA